MDEIGLKVDEYYSIRSERLRLQKEVDHLEDKERELKTYLINNIPKHSAGVSGLVARVQVISKDIPVIEDMVKFRCHILESGDLDLIGKSISKAYITEKLENGEEIPGIGVFKNINLSLRKL